MAGKGGKRPGAGRPKGTRTRIRQNQTLAEQIAEETKRIDGLVVPGFIWEGGELKRVSGKGGGEKPLEYMLRVMNDVEASDDRRERMAESAAPYVHPKLQNIGVTPGGANAKNEDGSPAVSGKGSITVTMKFDGADDKEIK